MLNEMCCFWVNTSTQVKSHSPQEKIHILQDLKELAEEILGWLQSLSGGSFF